MDKMLRSLHRSALTRNHRRSAWITGVRGKATWTEVSIPSPDGRIAAKVWGNPQHKPIIAVHGWLDNANSFDFIAPALTQLKYQVCCMDLLGHGHSDHTPLQRVFAGYVCDLKAVVEWYASNGFEQPVVMGHSLGANTSMLFSGAFPHQVSGLILLDSVGPIVQKKPEQAISQLVTAINHVRTPQKRLRNYSSKAECVDRLIEANKELTLKAAQTLCERGVSEVELGKFQFRHDLRLKNASLMHYAWDQSLAFMRQVQAPTLAIMASRGVYVKGLWHNNFVDVPTAAEAFREGGTRFDLVEVDGDHHVHLTHPEIVIPHIKRFLSSTTA